MWIPVGGFLRRIERESDRINRRRPRNRHVRGGDAPCGPKLVARGRALRPGRPILLSLIRAVLYFAVALGLFALAIRFAG